MSRFYYHNEKDEEIIEIESEDICKWKINEICCNGDCEYVADYPHPYCKCESLEDCKYFEKEDGKI